MEAYPTSSELRELLPYLTQHERAEMDRLLAMDTRLWKPLPGPQTMAYYSQADELLYGGSAGGGKTDLLVGMPINEHRRAIIFRREYTQLKDMVDRSKEIVQSNGRYNENANTWRGLPGVTGGRVLEFAAMQREADWQKFRGRAKDYYGFDELTEFVRMQYKSVIAWNRTTVPGQRCRVVCASNPPSSSDGEWVIEYWSPWLDEQHPQPASAGELRWFAMIDGKDVEVESAKSFDHKGQTIKPKSRTFVPARVTDNPFLMATDYMTTLQNLPEPLRSQLMFGDWKAGRKEDPWQIIPTRWVELAQKRWREMSRPDLPLTALGVDVARGGDDKTAIAPRYGAWFGSVITYPGSETPNGPIVAGLVLKEHTHFEADIHIDVIGVGASVYDALREHTQRAVGVNFAGKSEAHDRSGKLGFVNVRAEAYWKLREALDPDYGTNIALPDDPELKSDLCAPRWSLKTNGIQVESKEEIIKRIGRSPDKGDAVALSNLIVAPAEKTATAPATIKRSPFK